MAGIIPPTWEADVILEGVSTRETLLKFTLTFSLLHLNPQTAPHVTLGNYILVFPGVYTQKYLWTELNLCCL